MRGCTLVRHAETEMAGRFCGHSNPLLNAAGWRQAQELAESLAAAPPEIVYASDLARAQQTAHAIGMRCGVRLEVRPGLREISFGRWEGLTWEEIEQRYPDEAQRWLEKYPEGTIAGGEACDAFRERVRGEMEFLLSEAATRAVVAVTHAGFLQVALVEVCGVPEQEAREKSARYGSMVTMEPRRRWAEGLR